MDDFEVTRPGIVRDLRAALAEAIETLRTLADDLEELLGRSDHGGRAEAGRD